jgi:hypothetical protein
VSYVQTEGISEAAAIAGVFALESELKTSRRRQTRGNGKPVSPRGAKVLW